MAETVESKTKKSPAKETEVKKNPTKTTSSSQKKASATKKATSATSKKTLSKASTKKAPAKKTASKTTKSKTTKKDVKKVIDPKTGKFVAASKPEKKVAPKPVVEKKVEEAPKPKKIVRKPAKELTIEPTPKAKTPLVRPTPKKNKELNKEEKALYKQLAESYNFIASYALMIEERTMDKENIPDLAIGELHVIDTVNRNNNKPMSLIARKEHITVGALATCVNRLVQKGYLLRVRDEMDKRIILLSVTQKGKKVVKAHEVYQDNILGLALDNLQLSSAVKVLSQFASVLEAYYDPSTLEKQNKK